MSVTLTDIGKRFGPLVVLDRFTAFFPAGKATALMGPSGAGKSTVLALIAGLIPPDAGIIAKADDDLDWIFQTSPLLMRRTARDNAALGLLGRGIPRDTALALADEALDRLGLAHAATQTVFRLSGGERQRVAVARALITQAPVLLADEPTASLDGHSRALITDGLTEAAARGATVIVATHDPTVAAACDAIVRIDQPDN